MKKTVAIAIALILLLFSTGCAAAITSGEVVDKTFTPAHTQLVLIPVCITNGKTVTTHLVPYFYYYADRWDVTIRA